MYQNDINFEHFFQKKKKKKTVLNEMFQKWTFQSKSSPSTVWCDLIFQTYERNTLAAHE